MVEARVIDGQTDKTMLVHRECYRTDSQTGKLMMAYIR